MKQKSKIEEKGEYDEIKENYLKLSKGAKTLATLLSLFNNETKLEDLKKVFVEYINKTNNELTKSENFINYFNELHDYFIYSKNIDSNNENLLQIFQNCPRIICDFKKANYRKHINEFFINIEDNDFNSNNFIISCNILNPIINLIKLYKNTENNNIININKIKLENLISDKIINNYETLYYSAKYEKYKINIHSIGDNYNVLLLNKVIDLYEILPNSKLQNFILKQINIILEALYNPNTNFSYSDIFEIPILISKIDIISTSLKEKLNMYEIIVKLYNQIYLVEEYMALDLFENISPKKYALFKEKYFDTIRRFLKQNIINNAVFFEEQDMNEELKYLCDVSCDELLNKFHLEKDDYFFEELMEIADYLYED